MRQKQRGRKRNETLANGAERANNDQRHNAGQNSIRTFKTHVCRQQQAQAAEASKNEQKNAERSGAARRRKSDVLSGAAYSGVVVEQRGECSARRRMMV